MPTKRFPKADTEAAFDFYQLGRAKLARMKFLTTAELRQSIQLALLAHETGVALHVLAARSHLCGPRRRIRDLVKKR